MWKAIKSNIGFSLLLLLFIILMSGGVVGRGILYEMHCASYSQKFKVSNTDN